MKQFILVNGLVPNTIIDAKTLDEAIRIVHCDYVNTGSKIIEECEYMIVSKIQHKIDTTYDYY